MNVSKYQRLTTIAVGALIAVHMLIVIYLWQVGRLSGLPLFAVGKVVFIVVAFTLARRQERNWMGLLALAGFGAGVRALFGGPHSPLSWMEAGAYIFVGATAGLWWRAYTSRTELTEIAMIPLLATIESAFATYGNPVETHPDEDHSESTIYSFEPDAIHKVVIAEWRGLVHSVTYWSQCSHPDGDLRYVLRQYAEGKKWRLIEKGYLFYRKDGDRRLWCSVAPAIGVGTMEHMRAKSEDRRAEQSHPEATSETAPSVASEASDA